MKKEGCLKNERSLSMEKKKEEKRGEKVEKWKGMNITKGSKIKYEKSENTEESGKKGGEISGK